MTRTPTCTDCYFRRNGLCALDRDDPCPTFRLVRGGRMTPPPQAPLLAPTRPKVAVGGRC